MLNSRTLWRSSDYDYYARSYLVTFQKLRGIMQLDGNENMMAFCMCALFFPSSKCIEFGRRAGIDPGEAKVIILA